MSTYETDRSKAAAFFYEHAGYSYNPATETAEDGRTRCAEKLARAEEISARRGWYVRIHDDHDGPMEDDVDSIGRVERGEAVCLGVTLQDETGRTMASLWGIVVRGDPWANGYRHCALPPRGGRGAG